MSSEDLSSCVPGLLAARVKEALEVPEALRPLVETTSLEVTRCLEVPISPGFSWSAHIRIRDFGYQGSWRGESPDATSQDRPVDRPVDVRGFPQVYAEATWSGSKINDFKDVGVTCWDLDFAEGSGAEVPTTAETDRMLLRGHFEPLGPAQVSGFFSRGGAELTPDMRSSHLESLVARWQAGTLAAERFRLLTDDGDLFDGTGLLIGMTEHIRSTGQLRMLRAAFDEEGFEALFDLGLIYSGVNGSALSRTAAPKLRDRLDAALADESRSAGLNFHLAISLETFARFLAERPEPRPFWRSHRRELGKDMIATLLKMEVERIKSGMTPDAGPGAS